MIQPPKPLVSSSMQAGWLNVLARYSRQLRTQFTSGAQSMATTKGVLPGYARPGIGGGGGAWKIKQFVLVSDEGDYLYCKEWAGTALGDAVKVVKPFTLRKTPFDGRTITYNLPDPSYDGYTLVPVELEFTYLGNNVRKVTRNTLIEKQCIVPLYRQNDLIYATKVSNKLVAYYEPTVGSGLWDDTDLDYAWVDMNLDGRQWAKMTASYNTIG